MFKHFINCVEESNPGYKWAWDEKSLVHKFVGVVLGEEEYRKTNGDVGVKLVVKDIKTAEQIMNGDFKTPPVKKLVGSAPVSAPNVTNFVPIENFDDLPFN